jgi:hypothetical protein
MSAPLAIAPSVTTYTSRTPYLTPAEYQTAPTAVDASNLVEGGAVSANFYELNSVIARASSWADDIVMQGPGCIAATRDIDGPKRLRVSRWGTIRFPCRFRPILEVDAISIGPTPSLMTAVTAAQAADLVIGPAGVLEIPLQSLSTGVNGISTSLGNGYAIDSRPLVQVTYVNGYPNTTLTAAVTAGATILSLPNVVGIDPGTQLTIYDDYAMNEQVTVGAGYVYGSSTVPLASPLLGSHTAGVSVSALPPKVKQAVISLTSCLIKTRGNLAMVMASINGGAGTIEDKTDGAVDDLGIAIDLLDSMRRVR